MEKKIEERILQELKEIKDALQGTCKPFMNLEQCAKYIGLSKNSVYLKTSNNEIPFYRIGKRLIFKTSEINEWILNDQKKTKSSIEIDQLIATELLIKES